MERELEVKLLGVDVEVLEEQVLAKGGVLIADEMQTNILIEPTTYPLIAAGSYLRIRETEDLLTGAFSKVMTFKSKQQNELVRENLEITSSIGDTQKMLAILKEIGMGNSSVGTKHRRSYSLGVARIDIDRWDADSFPYPYAEIEVPTEADLEAALDMLSLEGVEVSTKSIKELQDEWRKGQR